MKVLVTGATGFIGNYVVQELLNKGASVITTSTSLHKAESFPWFVNVRHIPFNINDAENEMNLFSFFHSPDVLIHLAWQGLPDYKSPAHTDQYLPKHTRFLNNLIEHGLQNVTVAGTCLEYGLQEGCLSEELDPKPSTAYAIAKNELRKTLVEMQQQFHFKLTWVRLFYMYGKGQNPKSLFSQLDKAIEQKLEVFNMSNGDQQRDYLSVKTVAGHIVSLALQEKDLGTINCCSGVPVTILHLVKEFISKKNSNIRLNTGFYPYPDYEPKFFWGDNKKLKKNSDYE